MAALKIVLPVAALAAAVLAAPLPASAHDVWITTMGQGGQTRAVVNFGHPDDRSLPYLEKLVTLDVVSGTGKMSLRGVKFAEGHAGKAAVLITPPFAMPSSAKLISASYDNGYYAKVGNDYFNTSTRMLPGASDSLWAPKFTKTLLGPGAYATVVGHDIELVPVEDPFRLAAGRDLHVKVLFRGKPLAGEKVELGDGQTPVVDKDIPRFTTDSRGVATIPMKRRGEVLLTVDHSVPGANPTLAKTDFYNASLEFTLR